MPQKTSASSVKGKPAQAAAPAKAGKAAGPAKAGKAAGPAKAGKAAAAAAPAEDEDDTSKKHVNRTVIADPFFWGEGVRKFLTTETALKLAKAQKKLEGSDECIFEHEHGLVEGQRERAEQESMSLGFALMGGQLGEAINYPYDQTNPAPRTIRDTVKDDEGNVVKKGSGALLADLQKFFRTVNPAFNQVSMKNLQGFYDSLSDSQKTFFNPLKTILAETFTVSSEHADIVGHLNGIQNALQEMKNVIKFANRRKDLPVVSAPTGIAQLMSGKTGEEAEKARDEYIRVFEECTGVSPKVLGDYIKNYKSAAFPKGKRARNPPSGKGQRSAGKKPRSADAIEDEADDSDPDEIGDDDDKPPAKVTKTLGLPATPAPVSGRGKPVDVGSAARVTGKRDFTSAFNFNEETGAGAAAASAPAGAGAAATAPGAAAAARAAAQVAAPAAAAGDGGPGN